MTQFYHCVPSWLLSRPFCLILLLGTQLTPLNKIWPDLALSTQLTPFKTIWTTFITVYPIDSFQDHMTWLLHCVPNRFLSRPFDLILSLCTLLTPFNTIWPNFISVYPIDSFQEYLIQFYHCVAKWLLSRPFDQILSLCTQMTAFKTIWPDFSLCTQLTPLKTIWPDFIIGYPIDSFQDHMTWFLHCVSNWLLSRPYHLILLLCTLFTPFEAIWPNFIIVVLKWVNFVPNTKILSYGLEWIQLSIFKTIWPDFCIVYTIDSFQDHLT